MTPDEVYNALTPHIPALEVVGLEFAAKRKNCEITLFCNTGSTLDFSITTIGGGQTAPAAIALLVREAESLQSGLRDGLRRRYHAPSLQYCILEDERSRSRLLAMVEEKHLSSSGAKLSYALCALLILIATITVVWQVNVAPESDKNYNIVTLLAALILPALAIPLPFVFEWLKSRGNPRWYFFSPGA